MKFKIGDTVVISKSGLKERHKWTIKSRLKKDVPYKIKGIHSGEFIYLEGKTFHYYPSELKLAKNVKINWKKRYQND